MKPTWRDGLAARLPFFYGWIILACVCCAGFARNGPAVATLSIFVEPMTSDFGWSRTALSGAVSLGGIMAALVSPLIGPVLDRRGARMMLCAAVLVTGLSTMLLSLTQSLLAFYVFFCIARMNFAGPFDIGIYGALNSWFVERRALASSIVNLAQMVGLIALPLIAHFAMQQQGWRAGWLAVGIAVLLVGFVPTWLFMVRRPEDVGLLPDGRSTSISSTGAAALAPAIEEPAFTRGQALRTPAFWLLSLYTAAVFPVQAGISLHQAPHLIERGLSSTIAATVVSTFSLASAIAGLLFGLFARRIGVRMSLALAGLALGVSAVLMLGITTAAAGLCRRLLLRRRHRRRAHRPAHCLGRLLRPRQLRRHPRRGADSAGHLPGRGTAALRPAARLLRHLRRLADLLCRPLVPQRPVRPAGARPAQAHTIAALEHRYRVSSGVRL